MKLWTEAAVTKINRVSQANRLFGGEIKKNCLKCLNIVGLVISLSEFGGKIEKSHSIKFGPFCKVPRNAFFQILIIQNWHFTVGMRLVNSHRWCCRSCFMYPFSNLFGSSKFIIYHKTINVTKYKQNLKKWTKFGGIMIS